MKHHLLILFSAKLLSKNTKKGLPRVINQCALGRVPLNATGLQWAANI